MKSSTTALSELSPKATTHQNASHINKETSSSSLLPTDYKKSPNLVFRSSKKIMRLSLFSQFTFSLTPMVIQALLQLFLYSIPITECLERPSIHQLFPYGIFNSHNSGVHQRNSRLFPNLAVNLPPLRDSIPSSSYSKSVTRASQARQIQPLSCVSKRSGDKGVCMFAWTCVEQGGEHLGTCIDRFYFGSCCKLKEDNAIPDVPSKKPIQKPIF